MSNPSPAEMALERLRRSRGPVVVWYATEVPTVLSLVEAEIRRAGSALHVEAGGVSWRTADGIVKAIRWDEQT